MLQIKNKYSDREFIYICILREYAKNNNFLVLPKHPLNLDNVSLLKYDEGIKAIDWQSMERSSSVSSDIKLVKMAECLTDKPIYIENFQSIAVKNEEIKQDVLYKLRHYHEKKIHVDIQKWLNTDNRCAW